MTDLETLAQFRLREARETLKDAENLLVGDYSRRSVVNRAYYAMFYAALALHLHTGTKLKTTKHSGVISDGEAASAVGQASEFVTTIEAFIVQSAGVSIP